MKLTNHVRKREGSELENGLAVPRQSYKNTGVYIWKSERKSLGGNVGLTKNIILYVLS